MATAACKKTTVAARVAHVQTGVRKDIVEDVNGRESSPKTSTLEHPGAENLKVHSEGRGRAFEERDTTVEFNARAQCREKPQLERPTKGICEADDIGVPPRSTAEPCPSWPLAS